MNEELQKQLSEVVRKGIEAAEKTGQFVMSQTPDLLKEFYTWRIIDAIFSIMLAILIFLIVRYSPRLWLNKQEDMYSTDVEFFGRFGDMSGMASWIVFIIGCVISFVLIITSIYTLTFIYFAPKLYLINYFLK